MTFCFGFFRSCDNAFDQRWMKLYNGKLMPDVISPDLHVFKEDSVDTCHANDIRHMTSGIGMALNSAQSNCPEPFVFFLLLNDLCLMLIAEEICLEKRWIFFWSTSLMQIVLVTSRLLSECYANRVFQSWFLYFKHHRKKFPAVDIKSLRFIHTDSWVEKNKKFCEASQHITDDISYVTWNVSPLKECTKR